MRHLAFAVITVFLSGQAIASEQSLLPEAAEVRVFGGVDFIMPSAAGTPTGTKSENGELRKGVPATDGGPLSTDEIALLRRAVRVGAKSTSVALCCTPRHAFLFYDKQHRVIDYLDVCFECGCAHIYPPPKSLDSFSNLNWDHEALTRIVEAHHLPPLPKRE